MRPWASKPAGLNELVWGSQTSEARTVVEMGTPTMRTWPSGSSVAVWRKCALASDPAGPKDAVTDTRPQPRRDRHRRRQCHRRRGRGRRAGGSPVCLASLGQRRRRAEGCRHGSQTSAEARQSPRCPRRRRRGPGHRAGASAVWPPRASASDPVGLKDAVVGSHTPPRRDSYRRYPPPMTRTRPSGRSVAVCSSAPRAGSQPGRRIPSPGPRPPPRCEGYCRSPPMTRTRPSGRSVAVWDTRASASEPAGLNVPAVDGASSAATALPEPSESANSRIRRSLVAASAPHPLHSLHR